MIRVVDDIWPEALYERGYVKSRVLKKILNKLANFPYDYPKFILPLTILYSVSLNNLFNL